MVRRTSIVKEFWLFMKANKLYWMAPILIVLLLLIVLVIFGGSPLAPLMYPFF